MTESRRDFLRFVLAGSVAAGCPFDLKLLAADPDAPTPQVDGDHYDICHKVRDGEKFIPPPVTKRHDIVIVGGGISGLSSAYFLRDKDFLLLEKEPHWGGNAYKEEYQGQGFATGSAYDFVASESAQLAKEIGLEQLPVNCADPTILKGKWIADTWRSGLDELPYSEKIREAFKQFRKKMLAIDPEKNVQQLDNEPLTKYLQGFPPEIARWWDAYGPSNWGAKAAETSTYIALDDLHDFASEQANDNRITLPGGNGAISEKLAQFLQEKHAQQMLTGATTVIVEQQKANVRVTYFHQGRLQSVAARLVIMAAPKLIASRITSGISPMQRDAMQSIRYAPYPVINMIFDRPIYNRGYDTWCPGNSFTDFTVADWTIRNQPGYQQKNNILTFYTPLAEEDRFKQLTGEGCQKIALDVLRDFKKLLPEFEADPIELHMYRRGHPMFMATPGNYTKTIPAARHPLERVFFANTDSEGPESLSSGAVAASQKAADWVAHRLDGKSATRSTELIGYAV
jgi:monoamine oxidase